MRALVEAAIDAETQWLVVEQDTTQPGTTPLECVAQGLKNLRELLER